MEQRTGKRLAPGKRGRKPKATNRASPATVMLASAAKLNRKNGADVANATTINSFARYKCGFQPKPSGTFLVAK